MPGRFFSSIGRLLREKMKTDNFDMDGMNELGEGNSEPDLDISNKSTPKGYSQHEWECS